MKIFIESADSQLRVDGSVRCNLLNYFNHATSQTDADICVVPVSFFHDFKFNVRLLDITIPVVVLDMLEYEWCYFDETNETHLFGKNTADCRWLNPHWLPLDDWLRNNPPLMYFKRELLKKDETDTVKPCEWLAYLPDAPFDSEDDFNKRPIEVFYNFGFSHPNRMILYGDIFSKGVINHGLGIISEASQYDGYFKNPAARTWVANFCPWFSRVGIADIVWWQKRAKITPSLFGCGRKCFRHGEVVDSIMAKQIDDLAWSFPWTEENSILLRPGHEFEDLESATHRTDLYSIYKAGHANVDRYRGKRYVNEYMMPAIEGALK